MTTRIELLDSLHEKIKRLSDSAWDGCINRRDIDNWVKQFAQSNGIEDDEQLHALFLLSNFTYFGQAEIRELLRSLYRDLYKSPIVRTIRKANADVRDKGFLEEEFRKVLRNTRFLGIGNPSESGSHLLYYFRQENRLAKTLFINSHRIFARDGERMKVRSPEISHYIFIDDLCGSGTQASQYSEDILKPLKDGAPDAKVFYLVLFATKEGLDAVRALNRFDQVSAVFELDGSFQCLEPMSRIFKSEAKPFVREKVRGTCEKYGTQLWPEHPLGYKGGQLLIGFNHNTPDNTLPIFWKDQEGTPPWTPIFRRYDKDYGW